MCTGQIGRGVRQELHQCYMGSSRGGSGVTSDELHRNGARGRRQDRYPVPSRPFHSPPSTAANARVCLLAPAGGKE